MKIENVVGALSLALADDFLKAAQSHTPKSLSAAAIALVGHAPGITVGQLSRALGLSHPGAVRLVDRLAEGELLNRERSVSDGRAVALTLTEAGEDICQRILSSRQSALSRALASLCPADRETLGRIAEVMLRGMLKDEDHAFEICRLCDPLICNECPVEAEIVGREAQG
ncbi:MAG: MarR family transcriptional regulator [Cyanobacteria bacterium P01_A01_bin.17]